MSGDVIQRELAPIDERLPFAQFMEEAYKQVMAIPDEIEENGVTYELVDYQQTISDEYMNGGGILFYRRKVEQP